MDFCWAQSVLAESALHYYPKDVSKLNKEDINYISAERQLALENEATYRTEFEQATNPYPKNLQFHCFYEQHDDEFEAGEDDSYKKQNGSSRGFKRFSWNDINYLTHHALVG